MKQSKLTRLLDLLRLLQGGSRHNVDALAAACGVHRRTVFRDLDMLRAAGIPLVYDEQLGRYHVPGPSLLPATNFTADEALAVIALCHELGGDGSLPFYLAARGAALKLESNLSSSLREQVKALTRNIRIRVPPVNRLAGQKTVYDQLVEASAARRAVRIVYDSFAEGIELQTKLSPYQLLFSRHSWYVIGRSSLHRETRTFNVGRIRQLTPLADTFEVPRGFSIERYLGNAWSLIPEPGPDRQVILRFQPLVARNVAEVQWHKTQQLDWNDDGTLDFQVTVSGLGEIAWWILGYGEHAEVLEPPELREKVTAHARKLLERYNASDQAAQANGKPKASRKAKPQPTADRSK